MDRIYVWYDKNVERRISNIWPPITGEKAIGEPEIYVKETSQQLAKPAVEPLLIALREIANVNHTSAKCGNIAIQALSAYDASKG